ncbi:hypothetical protein KC357_g70 [Hortaea werneckii]|nr:hypothetical protein KC357_g70 [Hortaea werneckii]
MSIYEAAANSCGTSFSASLARTPLTSRSAESFATDCSFRFRSSHGPFPGSFLCKERHLSRGATDEMRALYKEINTCTM